MLFDARAVKARAFGSNAGAGRRGATPSQAVRKVLGPTCKLGPVSTKPDVQAPRLAGAILCSVAALLLLLSSAFLYAFEAGGWGPGLLLLTGLGLLLAALKSFKSTGRSG